MMIGKRTDFNPTVQVHSRSNPPDHPTADDFFNLYPTVNAIAYPYFNISPRALRRYLPPSYSFKDVGEKVDFDSVENVCDNFHMFVFKVKKCMQSRSHDWMDCPFAHPGERARRRDPRKYHYSGTACPYSRKESCRKGDACEFAHGVFEWGLHPDFYRTEVCKDRLSCQRKVCFFAHSPDQLRVVSPRPQRHYCQGCFGMSPESPPMSPMSNVLSRSLGSSSSLHQLQQMNKVSSISIPCTQGKQESGSGFGSHNKLNMKRPVNFSLPTTPTQAMGNYFECRCREEPVMERVESGRDLRAKIFKKLSKENSLNSVGPSPDDGLAPDIGWVSELVK